MPATGVTRAMSPARHLLPALPLLLLADPALALRCQGRIISEGDPQPRVLKLCGEPTAARQQLIYRGGVPRVRYSPPPEPGRSTPEAGRRSDELLIHDRSLVEVVVEEWTYNLGPHKLMRVVRFEDGLVVEVRRLGYGYHE